MGRVIKAPGRTSGSREGELRGSRVPNDLRWSAILSSDCSSLLSFPNSVSHCGRWIEVVLASRIACPTLRRLTCARFPAPYTTSGFQMLSRLVFASSPNPFPRAVGGPPRQLPIRGSVSADLPGAVGCSYQGHPGPKTSPTRANGSTIFCFAPNKR